MYHYSWEPTNARSTFACFRLGAATLCSMICCDWQTPVLTHTHTHTHPLSLLSKEHRCLWWHLFCISCHAISRLWKPQAASCACKMASSRPNFSTIMFSIPMHQQQYDYVNTKHSAEITRKLVLNWIYFWLNRMNFWFS